ncbi:MAG: leucine-rich repeat domain-containing protein, partial [Planctomycetia bacterium]|nr:leucine-rich repeat domain-containing protein [Planctomycetia bacterium]
VISGDMRGGNQLYIPASVDTIGILDYRDPPVIYGEPGSAAQAFAETYHLTFVPGRIETKASDDFVIENGILTTYLGKETEPELPQGIREIGSKVFSNGMFSALRFPAGLETIWNLSCQNCGSLQTVEFPASLRSIGNFCFSMCYRLKEARLPDGLRSLGMYAFSNCGSLTNVYLPASLIEIGNDAFTSCSNLTIHAPAGSYVEQYAKEHNIPFAAE